MPRPPLLAVAAAIAAIPTPAWAQWDLRYPAAPPAARVNMGMTYDGVGVLMFGGSTTLPAPTNQTWRWDGSAWSMLTPATSPTGRFGIELVRDSLRNVVVMYGGWTSAISIGNANDETWEWNGSNWNPVATPVSPGGLFNYALAFDASRGRTVLYGGSASLATPLPLAATWEYDGATWTSVATPASPGPLERAAMCWHAGSGKVVLFGGVDGLGIGTDTTWLFDGLTWTAATVTGPRPPARAGASMTYDPLRDVCVLTSGVQWSTGTRYQDTWEWNGAAWTLQPTTTTGVLDGATAFLPSTRQLVKFGGLATASPYQLNGETWEFGAKYRTFGTACVGSNGAPALAANGPPHMGQPWVVTVTNFSPVDLGVLCFGFGSIPPVDLTLFGMPTCTLYAAPQIVLPLVGSAGASGWTWPAVFGVVGDSFNGQAVSFDPPANLLGATTSNAISARIGL